MAGAFTAKYTEGLDPGAEDVWIETGTYLGNSTARALGFGFKELHTIEVNAARFQELETGQPELCRNPRVNRYLGSSRDWLPEIVTRVTGRDVVFWLDGHFQGESQQDRDAVSECPLLTELDAIVRAPWQRSVVVCIDDSNLFTDAYWTTGRERFTAADWPREQEIARLLQGWRFTSSDDNILVYVR